MICPNCHVKIQDDSQFCEVCGFPISQHKETESLRTAISEVSIPESSAQEHKSQREDVVSTSSTLESQEDKNDSKRIVTEENHKVNVAQVAVGVLFVVFGLYFYINAKSTLEYASFGGDFYTYTYKGIYALSNTLVTAVKAIGILISSIGALICFQARK